MSTSNIIMSDFLRTKKEKEITNASSIFTAAYNGTFISRFAFNFSIISTE